MNVMEIATSSVRSSSVDRGRGRGEPDSGGADFGGADFGRHLADEIDAATRQDRPVRQEPSGRSRTRRSSEHDEQASAHTHAHVPAHVAQATTTPETSTTQRRSSVTLTGTADATPEATGDVDGVGAVGAVQAIPEPAAVAGVAPGAAALGAAVTSPANSVGTSDGVVADLLAPDAAGDATATGSDAPAVVESASRALPSDLSEAVELGEASGEAPAPSEQVGADSEAPSIQRSQSEAGGSARAVDASAETAGPAASADGAAVVDAGQGDAGQGDAGHGDAGRSEIDASPKPSSPSGSPTVGGAGHRTESSHTSVRAEASAAAGDARLAHGAGALQRDRLAMPVSGDARIELDLADEGLGPLRLHALTNNGTLHLQLSSSDAGLRDMLSKHVDDLRSDIAASGLDLGSLDVGSAPDEQHGHAGGTDDRSAAANRPHRSTGEGADRSGRPVPSTPARPRPSSLDLAVDLRL